MHELSLCQSMRDIVEESARTQGFSRVVVLRLELGRFSCVEREALIFAFGAVMQGSVADNARLEIIELPGAAWCLDCACEVVIGDRLDPCPKCGGERLMVQRGEEMRIKEMEVI